MAAMNRLILELSPKPFRDLDDAAIRRTISVIFRQWDALVAQAGTVSFLLWTSDGSELLDYAGRPDAEFEWARWIGIANQAGHHHDDPQRKGLHTRGHLYCETPARWTYERLRFLAAALKEAGRNVGKTITVGTTFDPGPEFAASSFKYGRHPEILKGNIMGARQWVHCAAVLKADSHSYAGFPGGIPEGTPLGTFLGRQSQCFLTDMGLDYIWFSNGFGYSLDSWNVTGEVFDGTRFDLGAAPEINRAILRFWRDFRRECPDFPIETRGSNLSTGMDLASDASPVRDIYRGGFGVTAPVNSPWAAINGDYGLEITGWLSHIAELPENGVVPFRYYLHDPWWLNSPWLDRYGREPHDIYLPLSVGRIGGDGTVSPPDSVALLTIDDSYGRLPDEVPRETIPHLSRALADFPTAPGLLTWIYPFDEYHDRMFAAPSRAPEVFFGDWFVRAAINQGFPLNTVVSTGNFLSSLQAKPGLYAGTIVVVPVPDAGSPLAAALLRHARAGGRVLLYGPAGRIDPALGALLGLRAAPPLAGEAVLRTSLPPDLLLSGAFPDRFHVRALLSGGGLDTIGDGTAEVVAEAVVAGETRLFAAARTTSGGGRLAWVRGALGERIVEGEMLPVADDPKEWFRPERLMRWTLDAFGVRLRFEKPDAATPDPLVLAARCRGGLFFSGHSPSTMARLRWRLPQGVPVPVGCDVWNEAGGAEGVLALSRAWHRECRVLVAQAAAGELSCREQYSGEVGVTRRLLVRGLDQADVTFLPDDAFAREGVRLQRQPPGTYLGLGDPIPCEANPDGSLLARGVTGDLLISW